MLKSSSVLELWYHQLHPFFKKSRSDHKLTKFYGNLFVQNSHYLTFIIDTKHRAVQTCDSLNNHDEFFTNSVTLMRKWIAKMMSIIDFYINETNEDKNISFESEDMRIDDQMLDDDYDSLDTNNYIYMYQHEDTSRMKG